MNGRGRERAPRSARAPELARLGRLAAALLFAATVASCIPWMVPGNFPLVGPPPAPIQPEPTRCVKNETPKTDPDATIVGAADLHIHPFANRGFGGRFLWGEAFDPEGGIADALSSCGAEQACWDDREVIACREVYCRLQRNLEACQARCERNRCDSSPPHGHFGSFDPIGMVLGEGVGHVVRGYPDFQGWPHWNTYTHQQVYYKWLKRAFDGGLKLIVMHAVSNEVVCKFLGHSHPCDDTSNVDRQLAAARELEAFIDDESDCGAKVPNNGWFRIARSPQQARQIIADGAMAVVLGMEVDSPFNCNRRLHNCTPQSVRKEVDDYYADKDIRHIFPVHLFDNAFGGTAADSEFFNFGNVVVNHGLLDVRDCSDEGYAFQFDASSEVRKLLGDMARKLGVKYERYPSMKAHCNQRGLTSLGLEAIRAMMDAKMIIDVDHMSTRSREVVLDLATQCRYPGLVSGHSGFIELYKRDKRHEGQLKAEEVDKLLRTGGLLAPLLNEGSLKQVKQYERPKDKGNPVANDCGNSAKSFAQAYLYAADETANAIARIEAEEQAARARGALVPKRRHERVVGVGFGSDMNGLAGMPTPRFGPFACGGELAAEQKDAVAYPVATYSKLRTRSYPEPMTMDRMQAGYRKFDINQDGYANVGMFPDFVAELRAVGMSDDDLAPLFHSAEAYIQVWEGVDDAKIDWSEEHCAAAVARWQRELPLAESRVH